MSGERETPIWLKLIGGAVAFCISLPLTVYVVLNYTNLASLTRGMTPEQSLPYRAPLLGIAAIALAFFILDLIPRGPKRGIGAVVVSLLILVITLLIMFGFGTFGMGLDLLYDYLAN